LNPALLPPSANLHASYLDALREFRAEEPGRGSDIRALAPRRAFARWTADLRDAARLRPAPARGVVPYTILWYADDDHYIGEVQIRHELTDAMRRTGGHIGYEVRPSARRCGHATRMLALALPIAHGLGIDPALVTCDDTNVASRKVIEANGGVPDEPVGVKLRYWVATA